jgi:hypothetical protein
MSFQQMYLQSMESLRESSELPIELVTSHVTTCPCSLRPALKKTGRLLSNDKCLTGRQFLYKRNIFDLSKYTLKY